MKIFLCLLLLFSYSTANSKIKSKSPVPYGLSSSECLALNLYYEARAERTIRNISAVGHVTMRRKNSKHWPNTVCDVVYQQRYSKKSGWVAMYSWTKDGESDIPRQFKSYNQCLKIANMILSGELKDNTGRATHYHNNFVNPYWAKTLTQTVTLGNHIFYR